jgi:hypothetical protein
VDHPVLEGLEGYIGTTAWPPESPAFAVTDPDAIALARYRGTELVGTAVRDFGTWRSVFIGVPSITDGLAHNLAKWAGCWCAADAGDAVYANESFITIHGIFPGQKHLTLAGPSRVTDLTSGEVLAERTEALDITMDRAQTRWFHLEPR